jgi:ligand-binding sensor domain-containing protein
MALEGENLWVASGARATNWGKLYKSEGVYSFVNESWNSLNSSNGYHAFDSISDMVCVAIDPNNYNHVFVGTWGGGVMEFLDNQIINIYSDHNSSLQKWSAANYVAISGLAFDSLNNLWVANSGASSMLSVKETNGVWTAFSLGSGAIGLDIGKMMIDSHNQKWVLMRAENSLLVFSESGTISNPTDYHTKILTNSPGNGNLPGSKILSFAQDQDGELWLGSNDGIAVIYSPENVFTGGDYDAQRILVEVGGYVQYLLETETVTAIAIDNANRKWVGTENSGVYLFSADGKEELIHFTEENSPLFSNSIIDIKINKTNSEVFIATANGIISYKNEANSVNPPFGLQDILEVKVLPNPASNDLNFELPANMNISSIEILNIEGTIVKSQRINNHQNTINVSDLPSGMYVIRMQTDKGLVMKKLVKR